MAQAARFGQAELSRAADLVATGLTEMRGATAPRLLLELILRPGAAARRRPHHPGRAGPPRPARAPQRHQRYAVRRRRARPARAAPPAQDRLPADPAPLSDQVEAAPEPPPAPTPVARARARPTEPTPAAGAGSPRRARPQPAGGLTLVDVRRLWPDIVDATKQRRRVTWIHLTTNAQVVGVDEKTLTLGFANAGARDSFDAGGSSEIVRQAAIDVVGTDWRIETIVDPGASADGPPPPPSPSRPSPRRAPVAAPDSPPAWASDEPAAPATPSRRRDRRRTRARAARAPASPTPARPPARRSARPSRPTTPPRPTELADADADAHPDDPDADSDSLAGAELLARELGAEMIEEIPHS